MFHHRRTRAGAGVQSLWVYPARKRCGPVPYRIKPALTMFELPSCFRFKVNHIAKHSALSDGTRPLSVFRQS